MTDFLLIFKSYCTVEFFYSIYGVLPYDTFFKVTGALLTYTYILSKTTTFYVRCFFPFIRVVSWKVRCQTIFFCRIHQEAENCFPNWQNFPTFFFQFHKVYLMIILRNSCDELFFSLNYLSVCLEIFWSGSRVNDLGENLRLYTFSPVPFSFPSEILLFVLNLRAQFMPSTLTNFPQYVSHP